MLLPDLAYKVGFVRNSRLCVSVYVGNVPTHDSAFLNDKTRGIIVVMIAAIVRIVILGLYG